MCAVVYLLGINAEAGRLGSGIGCLTFSVNSGLESKLSGRDV